VMAGQCRPDSGVDADKQDVHAGANSIPQRR
jgi:hypothetical protein